MKQIGKYSHFLPLFVTSRTLVPDVVEAVRVGTLRGPLATVVAFSLLEDEVSRVGGVETLTFFVFTSTLGFVARVGVLHLVGREGVEGS